MSEEIKVGSIVEIRSGGPDMTVCKIGGEFIETVWMTHSANHANYGSFPPYVLKLSLSDPDHPDNGDDDGDAG